MFKVDEAERKCISDEIGAEGVVSRLAVGRVGRRPDRRVGVCSNRDVGATVRCSLWVFRERGYFFPCPNGNRPTPRWFAVRDVVIDKQLKSTHSDRFLRARLQRVELCFAGGLSREY